MKRTKFGPHENFPLYSITQLVPFQTTGTALVWSEALPLH